MGEPMISKYHQLEEQWVIRNSTHQGRTWWTLLHNHPSDGFDLSGDGCYGYVHSYMKLGSYKCNRCGAMAPTQVNGFYELCKWAVT